MAEVIGVRFKNTGKVYYFDPQGIQVEKGSMAIVETARGLECGEVALQNREVADESIVQPLRRLIRLATPEDLKKVAENHIKEKKAFRACEKKIAERGLEMKLVDVEYTFDNSKILFYFTADGRVDFRELVKDLAGIFRTRIELRQIGVRDEAKMIGGIGICGRPYCCSQFLDEFQPVSTKMAKVQSLSLNPAKISGSCGRLMCCLRYEQEAYEELIKKVPKQGAFVETKDGYGTAVQVNLLRQTVKVKLDNDSDDSLRQYKANELCAVPGGRPKDGETPPHVLNYVPEPEEPEETEDQWVVSFAEPAAEQPVEAEKSESKSRSTGRRRSRQKKQQPKPQAVPAAESVQEVKPQPKAGKSRKSSRSKPGTKVVKVEAKVHTPAPEGGQKPAQDEAAPKEGQSRRSSNRRRYYHGKAKSGGGDKQSS
mgnify:CR=1 FL=1